MIDFHRLEAGRFKGLGSGLGGTAAISDLAAAQRSKRLLLLRYLGEEWQGDDARHAIDVLIRADKRDPKAVSDLVGDPLVGAWAARTVRRVLGQVESPVPLRHDLAQLGALAAAAALRTGADEELRTHTRSGRLTLPTLGTADLGVDGPALVTVAGGHATMSCGGRSVATDDDERWWPLWRLAAEAGQAEVALVLEDGNAFRDCYHAPPADRLTQYEVHQWQELLTEAWDLLGRYAPERAAELAVGMRSLVPLITQSDGEARSGTARDAFGATGLTRPGSAWDFAVTLVHEFQHSKLSALLDLTALYTPGGLERHFAPWREDARPTTGLIQGVYAFLGVCDTWRALRVAPGLEERATREFANVRRQTEAGLVALEKSTELTPLGRDFVAELRGTLTRFLAEPVPPSVDAEADELLARLRGKWSQNNSGVDNSATLI
ncbi:HEXXH motif domain-containing protein [Asanoa siamensis]|uniref:HEXXH motif-containing protein n=1 Tax=Asanoa siamensis TaxID=926357 RepID=A0ABQ4CVG1_9ACTN|nr:HEXXH motif domain-containing protein [Asanoa siamensis]GIF75274.1 hypothetical protein Asi02nite_47920 [Asanoa siamensis]